jgi:hypothetical protein
MIATAGNRRQRNVEGDVLDGSVVMEGTSLIDAAKATP